MEAMPQTRERETVSWPRIVIGSEMPIRGDLIFVSTDKFGTPGELNSLILNQLGIPLKSLKTTALIDRGFAEISFEGSRRIVSVVTISHGETTESNLRQNLLRAISHVLPTRSQDRVEI